MALGNMDDHQLAKHLIGQMLVAGDDTAYRELKEYDEQQFTQIERAARRLLECVQWARDYKRKERRQWVDIKCPSCEGTDAECPVCGGEGHLSGDELKRWFRNHENTPDNMRV